MSSKPVFQLFKHDFNPRFPLPPRFGNPGICGLGVLSSQISGNTRFDCKVEGACWAWVDQRFGQFLFGFYPEGERWRVILAFILLFPALIPWLTQDLPGQRYLRCFSVAYPAIATILLAGGLGLQEVPTDKFGGFMLNLIVGLSGIVLSPSGGNSFGAGQAVKITSDKMVINRLYRGHPRRSFNNAVICLKYPSAHFSATGYDAGSDYSCDHNGYGFCVRIYGRGNSRWTSGYTLRSNRSRPRDGSQLLEIYAADCTSSGPENINTWHRQHIYWAI